MTLLDLLFLALQNLFSNRLRSVLTMLGVSIGIGAVVFLVTLGFGLQRLTVSRIASSAAVTIIDVDQPDATIVTLNDEALSRFKAIEHVEAVAPVAAVPGQATYDATTTDVAVNAVNQDFFTITQQPFTAGVPFADGQPQVVISAATLKLFGIDSPLQALQKTLTLTLFLPAPSNGGELVEHAIEVSVVGTYDDSDPIIYLPLPLIPLSNIEYSQVKVKASSAEYVDAVKAAILEFGFPARSVTDLVDEINRVFRIAQYVLGGFGIIALFVASIGMFNTMTISLLERIHDIGIMKAIGARNRDIRRLFVVEAIMMSISGGLLGIAIAFVVSRGLNFGVNLVARSSGAPPLELFYFDARFLGLVMAFAAGVGLATGVYPALRAARLDPLRALRYE